MNGTYIFNTSGGWWNITGSSTGVTCISYPICFYTYPEGRAFAGMTWDGQLDRIMLTGGLTYGGAPLNDTEYFLDGAWAPSEFFFGSISGPPPGYAFAMPSNSSALAPLRAGGDCVSVYCYDYDYVLEEPPYPYFLDVTPTPTDVGYVVNVSAALSGTGSGPFVQWYLYDNISNSFFGYLFGYNFSSSDVVAQNFTYTAPADAGLTFWITDYFGVAGNTTDSLNVFALPSVAPSAGLTNREVGLTMSFTSGLTGGTFPYTYSWNFGDGSGLSALQDPTHVYTAAGSYTVSETVTDALGAVAMGTTDVTIAQAVTSAATASDRTTDVGVTDSFTANAALGSGSYTYAWAFGDGDLSTAENPTHAYAATGTYTVDLTVTDAWGASCLSSTTVNVIAGPSGTVSANTITPNTKTSVHFTANGTGGVGAFSYAWTFGDGAVGTGATPTHTYGTAGTYTVTVVITDHVGGSVTKTLTETVSQPPATSLATDLTQGTGLYVLIIVIVLVVAGAAVLLMRRKPRTPAPLTPADPATAGPTGTATPPPSPPPGAS